MSYSMNDIDVAREKDDAIRIDEYFGEQPLDDSDIEDTYLPID